MMRIELQSAEQFASEALPAYHKLVSAGEPATLELLLAPGSYSGVHLQLNDMFEEGQVELLLAGADPAHPAELHGVSVALDGRSVTLRNLLFSGISTEGHALAVGAAQHITVERCAFMANTQRAEPHGIALIELKSAYGQSGQTATFSDCWFIGNRQRNQATLIGVNTLPPMAFAALDFQRCAFLDNRFSSLLSPGQAGHCGCAECLVFIPAKDLDGAPGRLAGHSSPKTSWSFNGNILIAPGLSSADPVKALPEGARPDGNELVEPGAFKPKSLTALVEAATNAAASGPPNIAALRKLL